MPDAPTYLTVAEAAPILRLTPYSVLKLCRTGKLRASKPDGMWYITPAAIEEYVAGGLNQAAS